MLTLTQLLEACNQLYPKCADSSYNGLQVEGQKHIARVATAVSADLATIEHAIQSGVQALIVHHGLFWERSSPCLTHALGRRARALLEAEVSLLAYHLPMDMHRQVGNNWGAANDLVLRDLQPFGSCGGLSIGVCGEIQPEPWQTFLQRVERYYGCQARHAPGGPQMIRRVAILSGSGHKFLEEAALLGCDALITGTGDEPQWHIAREMGIHLIAIGHAASERIGPKRLTKWLREELGCETIFLEDQNPF
jgi:dinuclear metal center YbgI/SA1388 family protein